MNYICHRDFNGMAEAGHEMHIRRGTLCPVIAGRVLSHNASVCITTSYNSHKHFALNDDGRGLYRGDLTWAIAFSPREREHERGVFRFSEQEIGYIEENFKKFLKQTDPILFNDYFFMARIEELEELAEYLNLDVREED